MKDQYYPDGKSTHLQYLDAKHIHGQAIIQKLPTHQFSWEKVEHFIPEKIYKLVKKDKKGYILEVDVDYLEKVHKNHNELPFLAERMKIGKVEKLKLNLKDKKMYTNLKLEQALKHGLKLNKVHWVIRFGKSYQIKPYIMLNTKLRTAAKSEFEKDLFKLMKNDNFRKTMLNIRNQTDMKLVTRKVCDKAKL